MIVNLHVAITTTHHVELQESLVWQRTLLHYEHRWRRANCRCSPPSSHRMAKHCSATNTLTLNNLVIGLVGDKNVHWMDS